MMTKWRARLAALTLLGGMTGLSGAADAASALDYLESLKGKPARYLAPSQIDPRYTMALYVNASNRGANRQRMWVLQRDKIGGSWRLGMWDKAYWKKRGAKKYNVKPGSEPPFSWLVSTGRKYRGDSRSGPTPLGVYSVDERRWRVHTGYHSRGMIHVLFIDYHYSSGRRSGVAFHGTTRSQYWKLGRIDSHGCIRMHQRNALGLVRRVMGRDKTLTQSQRWGAVPRYWKTERRGGARFGYKRDGGAHYAPTAFMFEGGSGDPSMLRNAKHFQPPVLTKSGYRVLTVIFRD